MPPNRALQRAGLRFDLTNGFQDNVMLVISIRGKLLLEGACILLCYHENHLKFERRIRCESAILTIPMKGQLNARPVE
jgi:hypothetical protein